MEFTQDKYFHTNTLPLATALALEFPWTSNKTHDPGKTYFVFPDSTVLQDRIKQYRAGQMLVDPKKYSFKQRELKSEIYGD